MNKATRVILILILTLILAGAGILALHFPDQDIRDIDLLTINGEYFYSLTDDEQLYGTWEADGVVHLFTPGFVRVRYVYAYGEKIARVDYEKTVHIHITDEYGNVHEDDICVHRGSSIYTINLSLPDGLEAAAINKEEYISGWIRVTDRHGVDELNACPVMIKGRGNSTWYTDKQPYILSFDDKVSLAGMRPDKKFILLANHYDGTKVLSKLMFDLNKEAGMDYTIDSEFADLYINGYYRGVYTVCEQVDHGVDVLGQKLQKKNKAYASNRIVNDESRGISGYYSDDNPKDISGVYIIEKDILNYYDDAPLGFTLGDYAFSVKYPNNLTLDEAAYLQDRFRNIDEMIRNKDPEVMKLIDIDSFATRFLIEEFGFNSDAGMTSWYFHYRSKDPRLYAGPGWDYDGTFGESNGVFLDYTQSITQIGQLRDSDEALRWDKMLLEIPEYRSYLTDKYKQLRPLFVDLYEKKAGRYCDTVRNSVIMDKIRWAESENLADSGQYRNYDSTEKYLKYYMYNRILMMDEMLTGEKMALDPPDSSGSIHTVTFCYPDRLFEIRVPDGQCLGADQLPEYDDDEYYGWVYEYTAREFSEYLPVYEDTRLELR